MLLQSGMQLGVEFAEETLVRGLSHCCKYSLGDCLIVANIAYHLVKQNVSILGDFDVTRTGNQPIERLIHSGQFSDQYQISV